MEQNRTRALLPTAITIYFFPPRDGLLYPRHARLAVGVVGGEKDLRGHVERLLPRVGPVDVGEVLAVDQALQPLARRHRASQARPCRRFRSARHRVAPNKRRGDELAFLPVVPLGRALRRVDVLLVVQGQSGGSQDNSLQARKFQDKKVGTGKKSLRT